MRLMESGQIDRPDCLKGEGIKRADFPKPEEFLAMLESEGLTERIGAYRKVLAVSEAVRTAGGRALLVGGSVRDVFFGKIAKDFDVEVYGLSPERLEEIVGEFVRSAGLERVSEVGKAFGILKIPLGHGLDLDLSLPRTDSKIGEGHRGFAVKTDPDMGVAEAAKRRDFTMNALAADPLTGELFDFCGGVEDIRNRRLRVTDPERFRDDPLRVLRGLQFIGRFGLAVEPKSAAIMREMAPLVRELPKERIIDEWRKLLLKSERPSLGLAAGMDMGVFREIHPELLPMAETEQEPDWHPEGNVWTHTLMSVDAASRLLREGKGADVREGDGGGENDGKRNGEGEDAFGERQALTVLLATLCHDIGKPSVTEFSGGRIRSLGHEAAGEGPARRFLDGIGADRETSDKVVSLVVNHLAPSTLYGDEFVRGRKVSDGAIRRLAKRIHPATIRELVLVAAADHLGRGPFTDLNSLKTMVMPPDRFPAKEWLLERAERLAVTDSRPVSLTRGQDWLDLGFRPGKPVGRLIRLSDDLRDELGWSRERILEAVRGSANAQEAIGRLEEELGRGNGA
ncbi:hypothetical protein JW899_03370 [Candidatus Uhrbacteria bacterium]|nr:hypothetical protein [Candidatus Uhrbacteria bacterium]